MDGPSKGEDRRVGPAGDGGGDLAGRAPASSPRGGEQGPGAKAAKAVPAAAEVVEFLAENGPVVEVGPVTYAADVAPILQDRCQSCHRPGQVGPFSLLTYDDAAALDGGDPARSSTTAGCPPGTPTRATATSQNDRSLSPRRAGHAPGLGRAGDAAGRPAGDPRSPDVPRGLDHRHARRRLRDARAVHRRRPRACSPTQRFRVPTNFTEDVWVQAAEARPGDRSVVHHICRLRSTIKTPTRTAAASGRDTRAATRRATCPRSIRPAPPRRSPPGRDLVFQIHYTPIGEVQDRPLVGRPDLRQTARSAHGRSPRGSPRQRFVDPSRRPRIIRSRSSFTFPCDAHLLSFMPHMHLRGKDFQYDGHLPRRPHGGPPLGPRLRLRLAELLPPGRAHGDAEGDADRLPGPLRQLGRQPGQPRPDRDGPLGRADLRRDDDRLHRLCIEEPTSLAGRIRRAGRDEPARTARPSGRSRAVTP